MVRVEIENDGPIEVPKGSDVSDVIQSLDYHIDSVIVLSDGEPVPLDDEVKEDMTLKILSVVSGG